jgi:hypothetical protein
MNGEIDMSITPAIDANTEAVEGIARLDRLAKAGDKDAIRLFHETTCGMVARLNELHLDFAQSVLVWPVLLPQDRDARTAVTMAANAMRIGSVKGGGEGSGRGAPELLGYNERKGFAIQNLRRVSYARTLLRMFKYGPPVAVLRAPWDVLDEEEPDDEQEKLAWLSELERRSAAADQAATDDIAQTMYLFSDDTGITMHDAKLLLRIRDLPDYSPATREEWLTTMVEMLRHNQHLVPDKFEDCKTKLFEDEYVDRHGDVKRDRYLTWSGAGLSKALCPVMATIDAVPGFWGQ